MFKHFCLCFCCTPNPCVEPGKIAVIGTVRGVRGGDCALGLSEFSILAYKYLVIYITCLIYDGVVGDGSILVRGWIG